MAESDNGLAHYGVKGMKWGVRKNRPSAADGPVEVRTQTRPGRRVTAKGGEYHSPSEDAVKRAKLGQRAKKSTVDSLSNKELKELVERMNLEQQYSRLNEQNRSIGEKMVRKLLNNPQGTVNQYKSYTDIVTKSYNKNLKGK